MRGLTPRPLLRLLSLVVVALFSATTITLPFADALLDHLHPSATARPADHLEGPGGCGAHAEHCLLSRTTATRPAHPAGAAAQLCVTRGRASATAPLTDKSPRLVPALPLSRAPPALPA
ncbi:MAG: hypothetical protein SGJ01_05100 [Gemmatimonadota bacterium]|nr:hypothetical protein [Gemmatimonadota bacterium]